MEIWPAIDVRGGNCVRLKQGDYQRETVYAADPAARAVQWVEAGAERLHLVDLDGARSGRPVNRDAIAAVVAAVDVPCQLGGGIRDEPSARAWLEVGLTRLVVGTWAVRDPEGFAGLCRSHPGRLVLGIDARDGHAATAGWLQTSSVPALQLADRFRDLPLAALVFTDIARDGMLEGPNVPAMQAMQEAVPWPVIASGGVTSDEDVRALARAGLAGCIIGRALYENRLSLAEAIAAAKSEPAAGKRAAAD